MTKIKVMSYNVQWFTGFNSQLDLQRAIIDKHKPDIIGLQELTTNGRINKTGRLALADYPYKHLSYHKNYLGFASKFPLRDVKSKDFRNQDPLDLERYGETRAYMVATLDIDGKQVMLINTHLAYLTPDVKYRQIQEIFNRAEKSPYTIIVGDFNCFDDYGRMYRQFIDAGYHLANCNPKVTKTWTNKTNPVRLSQFTYPTDNVITSGNITIKKAVFDKTKLEYLDGNPLDHIPLIVRLCIK